MKTIRINYLDNMVMYPEMADPDYGWVFNGFRWVPENPDHRIKIKYIDVEVEDDVDPRTLDLRKIVKDHEET